MGDWKVVHNPNDVPMVLVEDYNKLKEQLKQEQINISHILYAIDFAFSTESPREFWHCWNHGEWDAIKKEFPEFDGYVGE